MTDNEFGTIIVSIVVIICVTFLIYKASGRKTESNVVRMAVSNLIREVQTLSSKVRALSSQIRSEMWTTQNKHSEMQSAMAANSDEKETESKKGEIEYLITAFARKQMKKICKEDEDQTFPEVQYWCQ